MYKYFFIYLNMKETEIYLVFSDFFFLFCLMGCLMTVLSKTIYLISTLNSASTVKAESE